MISYLAAKAVLTVLCLQPLPDALRGEKWAFVQLPLGPLREMLKKVEQVSRQRGQLAAVLATAGGRGGTKRGWGSGSSRAVWGGESYHRI